MAKNPINHMSSLPLHPVNLAVDIGNSRIKWARFQDRDVVESGMLPEVDWEGLINLLKHHSADSVTLSSVVHFPESFAELVHTHNALLVGHQTPVPIKNSYSTPKTLGMDRLCAAIGAKSLFPDNPVLVVDIGTCIKFEFISSDGTYEGGNISPGLRMRFASLHAYTSKLPNLDPERSNGPIGKSTNDALRLGVQQGMLFEIRTMIDTMQTLYPNLKTVATGGDLPFFVNDLKTHIFADLLLVLRGINEIYLHNS
ncbi:MAG: type III pantothenate kinase [Bacteroidetes bacterium]|nr:MAG: type III pantothenate kinase [Bacteroidota bacterium]